MNQFDQDIIANKGYLYTTKTGKSSVIANQRNTAVTKEILGLIKKKKINCCNLHRKFKKDFDIAILRGVLHHLDQPFASLAAAAKIAKRILIIEPNGYNLILKLIEKTSPYHQSHQEKSFSPWLIRLWIKKLGGKIKQSRYIGLVPFFCPDRLADFLKFLEPLMEKIPFVKNFICGVYCIYFDS